MAVVLDALASHVMKMIMDMGEEEIHMLLGVSHEIKKLQGNVEILQNFLTDAERRRITDKSVQAWVSKLKDAMYEATDILDLCQLEAMDRQDKQHSSSGGTSSCLCLREELGCLGDMLQGILQPFLFCVQNPGFANEVGSRIKKLNEVLATTRQYAAVFNFMDLGSYEQRRRPLTSSAYPWRGKTFVQSDLVGDQIKKNTQELVHKLIDDGHHEHGSSAIRVVAIVGQGGIGKSTLAKKVFANEAIKEEFKMKIWLSVTKQFTKVDLLRAAISQAGGKHDENKDETILVQDLTDTLSKKKFLLVLDDVWNQEAWDHVLRVPVLNAGCEQPGSRVLVTTRNEDVVRSMGASNLRVNILNNEDAWCLLKKQLPQPQVGVESDFDELKDVGMKIVKKCDGLPLAIKVMGGLLSRRDPKERDWEIVLHKSLGWEEQEELNYSVSLSYDDLSPELKQCLLYYSLFPKGSGFIEDRVISMWISEGFVQHDGKSESDQLDLEQIGADYHRELVARNLLEPYDSTDNIWQYTLRNVVRSFAQFMAKEEAFVVHKDQADSRNLLPENKKFRRLSIELSDSKLELTTLENQETLRTLLIGCEIKPGGSLANFASLRVLDISSKESDWLVDSVCELRHLRYLSFSNTNISRLPGDIHKMRFLEHIHLMNCTKLEKLPNSITKLACLRHLSLYGSNVDVIPRGFGGLTNLRTLHGFPVKMDGNWCTLEELEALSHLRSLTVQSLENVPGSSVAKRAKISNKKSLEYLELNCYKDEEAGKEVRQIELDQQQRIEAVFDELCPPSRLQTLIIKRYFGRQLPDWLQSPEATTFKRLKNIDLVHITYCTRLPDGLCLIHGLEKLLIKDAPAIEHVGPDFQTLARGDGGVAFPHMRILELIGLSGWKEWDWEEEQSKVKAMPALELLKLTECKLTHLPPGLASGRRYNLRTIHLANLSLLEFVENFPSVVELKVYDCPELKRISGLAKLRTINIKGCPKLKLLEGVLVLDSMELDWEHWEVVGPDARCIPKGYQAGLPRELPPYLTRVLNNLESILQNPSSRPHDVPLKHLEEITNNFSEERILGRGGFGVVYKGVLQNGEMIAVKKIVSSLMPGQQKQFENEVYHLMKLNHPNIVRFVGYCYDIKKVCVEYNGRFVSADMEERLLCLEFLPKGSLDKYISDESSGLDWSTCYNIIEGICSGLCYLHVQNDKPIIHLDLKPANILLSDGMLPKIADFGQSRLLDHQQTICTASRVGTLGYMAREFVDRGKITPKADIFSLGVIMIEVVTGHKDYPDVITKMSSDEFINLALEEWRKRSQGYLSLETDCEQIKRCLQVGLICVNPDRTKRPSITKVISMLQGSESIDCDISNEATT